jgi:hypothetical protein
MSPREGYNERTAPALRGAGRRTGRLHHALTAPATGRVSAGPHPPRSPCDTCSDAVLLSPGHGPCGTMGNAEVRSDGDDDLPSRLSGVKVAHGLRHSIQRVGSVDARRHLARLYVIGEPFEVAEVLLRDETGQPLAHEP